MTTMNNEQADACAMLENIVTRAGGAGAGGVVGAKRLLGVNISTVKRYRKGTLTIPASRIITIKMINNLDDAAFSTMLESVSPGLGA